MSLHASPETISSPLRCGCCLHQNTSLLCSLPDDAGNPVALHLCAQCSALTPDYRHIVTTNNTRRQTNYYEQLWHDQSQEASRALVDNCLGIVHFYQSKGFLPPANTHPNIIEIGAGRGALLAALQREGYQPIGAEPAAGLVRHAQQYYGIDETTLQCMTADAFATQLIQRQHTIDIAFLWHVIEHVEHPAQLLTQLAAQLSDRGVLILQAPLPSSSSIFPEHLFLLTRHTVFALSAMTGLAVTFCDISHHEQFVSFVLCKPQSGYTLIEPPVTPAVDTWIADMQAAIVDLHTTCAGQKNIISNYVHTAKEQYQQLHSRRFLLKQLWRLSFSRKQHG